MTERGSYPTTLPDNLPPFEAGEPGTYLVHCPDCGIYLITVTHGNGPFQMDLRCRSAAHASFDMRVTVDGVGGLDMRLLAQGESAFLNPSSDPVLDSLPESARQLVIGARRERDEAIEDAKQTRRTVKVMEGGLLDRLRDRTEKAEEKALEEVRARDALTRDMTAILGAPDPARLQQINDAVRELESAAQGLAEANQKYSDALLALSLLFYRLPVYTPCDPVNIEVERQERFTQPKGGSMDAYLSKQTDHA